MCLGAHVSIAGGFDKCIDRITDMGGNCLMTFASSPRTMQYKALEKDMVASYLAKKKAGKITHHFFHAPYLVNLATASSDYLKASIKLLEFYQDTSDQIDGAGTIFHIGSSKEAGNLVLKQIATSVVQIQSQINRKTPLILENAAGQGGAIGRTLEQIKSILNYTKLTPAQIGVCLDTQHLFASGYRLDTVLDEFEKVIGFRYLKIIHVNDSKTEFNSLVDRHENLGKGKIGFSNLRKFVRQVVNLKLPISIPLILEVPGDGKSGPRKADIDDLKSMII